MAVKTKMSTKEQFISKLQKDKSIDWECENMTTRSLILDVLFILAASVDSEKYKQFTGFEKFLKENNITIELLHKPVDGEKDERPR